MAPGARWPPCGREPRAAAPVRFTLLPSRLHSSSFLSTALLQADLEDCFAVAGELAQEGGQAVPTQPTAVAQDKPAAEPAQPAKPERKPAGKADKGGQAPLKVQSGEAPMRRERRDD